MDDDPRAIFDHPPLSVGTLPPEHPSGAWSIPGLEADSPGRHASMSPAITDETTRPAPNDDTVIVVRKELADWLLGLNATFGKVIEQRDMAVSSMKAIQASFEGCQRSLSSLRGELDIEPEQLDKPPGRHRMPEPTFVK